MTTTATLATPMLTEHPYAHIDGLTNGTRVQHQAPGEQEDTFGAIEGVADENGLVLIDAQGSLPVRRDDTKAIEEVGVDHLAPASASAY